MSVVRRQRGAERAGVLDRLRRALARETGPSDARRRRRARRGRRRRRAAAGGCRAARRARLCGAAMRSRARRATSRRRRGSARGGRPRRPRDDRAARPRQRGLDHRDQIDVGAVAQRILHEMRARAEPQRHHGIAGAGASAAAARVARKATRPEKAGASASPRLELLAHFRAQAVGADQQVAFFAQRRRSPRLTVARTLSALAP